MVSKNERNSQQDSHPSGNSSYVGIQTCRCRKQQTTTTSHKELQRQRHSILALEKLPFNSDIQDKYVRLMNFKMEVMNILGTRGILIN